MKLCIQLYSVEQIMNLTKFTTIMSIKTRYIIITYLKMTMTQTIKTCILVWNLI